MHRNPVIVQVSDLHFGKSVKWRFWKTSINEAAKKALKKAILEIEPRPDFLVATGDLANGGKVEEMREAKQYLESILNDLWAEHQATRCILIPGNHDVWRTTWARPSGYIGRQNRMEEWNSVFPGWSFLSGRVPSTASEHLKPQSLLTFYQNHGGIAGGPASTPGDAQALADEAMGKCEYFPEFQVAFLKLDSNVRSKRWKPAHIARGMVGLDQRTIIEKCLRDYQDATADDPIPFREARRIGLVHHHVTRLPNVKQENWMLMDDAGEVARWLARLGVRLVLHGHFHTADVVGLKYWNTESDNSEVETIVVSAGSGTALDVDDRHNSCHYIDLGHFRTKIWRPLLDNGEYTPLAADSTAKFEFAHKPPLRLDEGTQNVIPIYVEALQASLAGEEKYADRKHAYIDAESSGYIDSKRNYAGSVTLEGKNVTKLPTTEIPFLFTAVGAQDYKDCHCRARDLNRNVDLGEPRLIEDRPIYVFPTLVSFHQPLPPQETFRIQVTFTLPMVMLDKRDYDMFTLLRFPLGLGHLKMRLQGAKRMDRPSAWEFRGSRLVQREAPLIPVTMVPSHVPGATVADGYEIDVSAPPALSYLIFYEELR